MEAHRDAIAEEIGRDEARRREVVERLGDLAVPLDRARRAREGREAVARIEDELAADPVDHGAEVERLEGEYRRRSDWRAAFSTLEGFARDRDGLASSRGRAAGREGRAGEDRGGGRRPLGHVRGSASRCRPGPRGRLGGPRPPHGCEDRPGTGGGFPRRVPRPRRGRGLRPLRPTPDPLALRRRVGPPPRRAGRGPSAGRGGRPGASHRPGGVPRGRNRRERGRPSLAGGPCRRDGASPSTRPGRGRRRATRRVLRPRLS